jgi:hypothetical protein
MANMRRARDAITGSTLSQQRRRGIDSYSAHYEMHHFELCHSDAKESRGRRGKHGGQRTARSREIGSNFPGIRNAGMVADAGRVRPDPAAVSYPLIADGDADEMRSLVTRDDTSLCCRRGFRDALWSGSPAQYPGVLPPLRLKIDPVFRGNRQRIGGRDWLSRRS